MDKLYWCLVLVFGICSCSSSVSAQSSMRSLNDLDVIDSYVAYIGPQDLYNSNGDRLTAAWQVVRQDRANFHRFGRVDELDEWDTFFADAGNRAAMEEMLRDGEISPSAVREVMSGGALIYVEILGYGNNGVAIRVTTTR